MDGKITPAVAFPNEPLTIEQAFNVLKARKARSGRTWAQTQIKNTPTSVAPFQDRVRFLTYAISLCKGQPKYTALLRIRLFMASHPDLTGMPKSNANKFIAQQLTSSMKRLIRPEQIEMLEKEAIDFVQQEIRHAKNTMIPLVGAA